MMSEKSEMLIFVLKALRRQRVVMRRTSLIIGTILILVTWLLPNIYESNVKISLDSFSNPLGSSLLAKEISLPDLAVNDETFGSRIAELQSNRMARNVAEKAGMEGKVSFDIVGSSDRRWVHKVFFPVMPDVYQVEVKRPKLTRLIKVAVRGRDDKKVKELADQYAETLIDRSVDKNLAPTRRLFRWLTNAIKDRGEAGEGDIEWDPKVDAMVDTIGAVALDTEMKRLMNDRLEVEQKLRAARIAYFDQHPRILKLNRAHESVEKRIGHRKRQIVSTLIRLLNGEFKITNITVSDPADLPEEPVFPSRLRLTLEAILLAAALGILAGMLAQARDRRICSAEDLPAELRGSAVSEHAITPDDMVQAILSDRRFADGRRILIVEAADDQNETNSSVQIARRIAQLGYPVTLVDGNPAKPLPDPEAVELSVPWADWTQGAVVENRSRQVTRVLPPPKDMPAPWSAATVAKALASLPPPAWVCVRGSAASEFALSAVLNTLGNLWVIVPKNSGTDQALLRYCLKNLPLGHVRMAVAILDRP